LGFKKLYSNIYPFILKTTNLYIPEATAIGSTGNNG